MRGHAVTADDLTGTVLAVAGTGAGLSLWWGGGPVAVAATALALALITARIVWQDLVDFTIPDAATVALGLLGLGFRLGEAVHLGDPAGETLLVAGLDAAICGGALLVLREVYYRRRGQDGVGLGDVKLAAAGGVLVGTTGFAWAVLGASLAGLGLVLALKRSAPHGFAMTDRVAFGAFLAPALWLAWVLARVATEAGAA